MVSGVATSSVVYNQKTYKQYEKWMEQQLIFRAVPTEVPLDYLDVYEEYFSNACDNEQKKHALLSLYNKDGLVKK